MTAASGVEMGVVLGWPIAVTGSATVERAVKMKSTAV